MTDRRKKCMSQWSDLPPELLSPIAESLDLIDLLGFRGVCKSWKSASSTASAQSSAKPWFLLYGENNSECQLLSESDHKYTISLPELDGATCLASSQGWLLVFQESSGSLFLFCPFSRAKIDLPNFPASQLSDHIAAFSSPPNSQDCILCVISRTNNDEWELNLLRRGSNEWTKHNYSGYLKLKTINGAAYHKEDGELNFFNPDDKSLTFSTKNLRWRYFNLISPGTADIEEVPFNYFKYFIHYFQRENLKNKLELAENVSLSTCGTQMTDGTLVFSESIPADAADDQSKRRQLKGVWIHPRFYQVSSNDQSW